MMSYRYGEAIWDKLGAVDGILGLSRRYPGTSNRILAFHSVGGDGPRDVAPATFRATLALLDQQYEIVDLPAVLEESPDRKRVALTFDDGYRDFHRNVRPILHEFDAPATVFVISGTLTDDGFAHEVGREHEYLTEAQLLELVDDDLVTVGNHTQTHPHLPSIVDPDRIRDEVAGAKSELEARLGVDVDRFCYPHTEFDERTVAEVRRTHDYATCGGGWKEGITPRTNPHLLPRIRGAQPLRQIEWEMSDVSTRLGEVAGRFVG